jgi:hypothetical protein
MRLEDRSAPPDRQTRTKNKVSLTVSPNPRNSWCMPSTAGYSTSDVPMTERNRNGFDLGRECR